MGVVQLVRAPDCGSGGRGFEPHLPPQSPARHSLAGLFHSPHPPCPPLPPLTHPSRAPHRHILHIPAPPQNCHTSTPPTLPRLPYPHPCPQKIASLYNTLYQYTTSLQKRKNKKIFCQFQKCLYFCTRFRAKESIKRSGSSVWLEYMPVTHGVASSSLVRTAKQRKSKAESGKWGKDVHFPLSVLTFPLVLGLLGFDSRDNGFVSMQADAPEALTTDAKQ